jgi:hypothetical protein
VRFTVIDKCPGLELDRLPLLRQFSCRVMSMSMALTVAAASYITKLELLKVKKRLWPVLGQGLPQMTQLTVQ